jgi:hypothetical protein
LFPDGSALALLLELLTKNPAAAARASCAFRFLNPATGHRGGLRQVAGALAALQIRSSE